MVIKMEEARLYKKRPFSEREEERPGVVLAARCGDRGGGKGIVGARGRKIDLRRERVDSPCVVGVVSLREELAEWEAP